MRIPRSHTEGPADDESICRKIEGQIFSKTFSRVYTFYFVSGRQVYVEGKSLLSRGIFFGVKIGKIASFFFWGGLAVDERSADRFYM